MSQIRDPNRALAAHGTPTPAAATAHAKIHAPTAPTALSKAREPVAIEASSGAAATPRGRVDAGERAPIADECELLVRARYPVIYVVSWEEARVEAHFRAIAQRRNKQFHVWSVTTGLREASAPSTATPAAQRGRGTTDPVDALTQVLDHKEPAIYLFFDLNAYLRCDCPANKPVIRRLREVSRALSDSYKTLVICSPLLDIAPELQKDVTVVDFALPGAGEVGSLLDRIVDDVREHAKITVDLGAKDRESLVRAAGGLTLQEAENVFAKTIVKDGTLDGNDVSTVFAEKQQIVRKSGMLEYFEASDALDDIGGMDELKQWLARRGTAFSDEARAFGLPAPKGVLLVGVQGCGKSLCAKAISRTWKIPLLRFDLGRVFSSLVGSSEENVRRAIAIAESIAPAILWIDEIEKAFAGASNSGGNDGGVSARVMGTLLTWMAEKSKPVFVMATANSISNLPPELLRKGRLDEIFFVDLPTAEDRRRIFEIHIAKRKRDPRSIDLARLGELSEGFSGAEIEQAIISSLFDAFAKGGDLTTELLAESIRETVPLSKTMHESLAGIRAWANGRARPAAKAAIAGAAPGSMRGADCQSDGSSEGDANGARQGRRIEM